MKHIKPKYRTLGEHTTKRFAERFGVKLTQFLCDNIIHQIHNNKGTFYKKQSNRVSIWDVIVTIRPQEIIDERVTPGELTVRIIYDKVRKCLVSVMTLDMDCEPEDAEFVFDDNLQ